MAAILAFFGRPLPPPNEPPTDDATDGPSEPQKGDPPAEESKEPEEPEDPPPNELLPILPAAYTPRFTREDERTEAVSRERSTAIAGSVSSLLGATDVSFKEPLKEPLGEPLVAVGEPLVAVVEPLGVEPLNEPFGLEDPLAVVRLK